MLEAAVDGAGRSTSCGVVAVTVLTSLTAESLGAAWARSVASVSDEVTRLAQVAAAAGAHGVVCSGEEAAAVRSRFGDRLALIVPGIRLPQGAVHDQARVVTPAAARVAGARYIVVGRTVTGATDPRGAMAAVVEDLDGA